MNITVQDAGHGYDRFGLNARALTQAVRAAWPLYRFYFRVVSTGIEHLPAEGPAILIANHAGALPFDAMMIGEDVVLRTRRPLRPVVDHFASALPFVGLVLQRIGAVGGTMENVRALLTAGERVLIFPEGVPGISKPRARRYHIDTWRVGHAALALRERVPIIPVAVIGAEEQLPVLFNARRIGRLFGLPHLPVPLVPFPLPVKYRIYYGPPVELPRTESAEDPVLIERAASLTKTAVEALVKRGLSERRSVFW